MCGIAGFINQNNQPASPIYLKRMNEALVHRGPDGEGEYVKECAAIGHRRLAIIDLSPAGHQPMLSKNGRYVLTYNGEIYNFNELRLELKRMGYPFLSRTDSEVVLHAYSAWGKDCVYRFNGMFAFAVWDAVEHVLFLARDRYGIKPLYYFIDDNIFIFASEQKAILAHPLVSRTLDPEALLEYFTFQNIFTDKTFLQKIRLLPAGSWAVVHAHPRLTYVQNRYWDFSFSEEEQFSSEAEYVEELDRLFKQAVHRQLITDVELGTYLSGGMDSGSLTAIAAKVYPYIKSFTCGFDLNSASGIELNFDERRRAEYMSYLFKTEHYEMVLKSGDMERILPKLAWHIEEPRVGQSYPNYYTAQLASKFVKVVLSGAGGDEFFGGYPWRYYRADSSQSFEEYIDKYYQFWQRLIPNSAVKKLFAPLWSEVQHVWTRDIFRNVFHQHAPEVTLPEDYVNHSLYFEAKTFLHGLLVVEDKLSMAHGLETRVPFLDNDLVDFAMKIPIRYKLQRLSEVTKINENEPGKVNKYFERTKDGKKLLRNVMQKYIPEEVTRAEKQGFSGPDASWFKGESMDYVMRILYDKKAALYQYLDFASAKSLMDEHLEGRCNRRLFIWSLLSFEHFIRKYLK